MKLVPRIINIVSNIIMKNTSRKYLVGNNRNFDLSDPDVYKVILPITVLPYVNN